MHTIPEEWSDTSRWSFHVDMGFYTELDQFTELLAEDWPDAGPVLRHEAEWLLTQEARRLDEHRYTEWLNLFTADCLYWIPVHQGFADPRSTVSHAFDDRRRLEDRVYWLNTGLAYSQLPPSRTVHAVSNVEVRLLGSDSLAVRSVFTTHEHRTSTPRAYSGWTGHLLSRTSDGWRIKVKRVSLLDSDAGHENLTLVL